MTSDDMEDPGPGKRQLWLVSIQKNDVSMITYDNYHELPMFLPYFFIFIYF